MSIFSRGKKFRNLVSPAIAAFVLSACTSQVAQGFYFRCFEFAPDLKAIHVQIDLPEFYDYPSDTYDVNLDKFFHMKSDFCVGCNIRTHDIWLVMDGTANVRIVYDKQFREENKDKNIKCYPTAGSWKFYFTKYGDMQQIIRKYILGYHSFFSYICCNKPESYDLIRNDGLLKLIASSDERYVKLNEELNKQDASKIKDLRIYSKLIVEFYNKFNYEVQKMFFDRGERCLYIVVKDNSNSIESAETEDDYIGIPKLFAKKIKEHKCKIGPVSRLLVAELKIKDIVNLDNTEQINTKENFVEIPEKFYGIFLSYDEKAISDCLDEIKKIIGP